MADVGVFAVQMIGQDCQLDYVGAYAVPEGHKWLVSFALSPLISSDVIESRFKGSRFWISIIGIVVLFLHNVSQLDVHPAAGVVELTDLNLSRDRKA